jgi:hypothetical protein
MMTQLAWEGLFGDNVTAIARQRPAPRRRHRARERDRSTTSTVRSQTRGASPTTRACSTTADGEATATYTDLSFPEVPTTAGDLDPDALAAARQTCVAYGIVDEAALADCVYDLAITGDLVFLRSAGLLQDSTAEGLDGSAPIDGDVSATSTVQDQAITGEIREPGDVGRHEFEAAAGDRVWVTVDAVNGDCVAGPDEHLGWELVSPVGERAAVQPDIRACSERGPLTLEDAGTWTLVVSAGENDPIDGHLRPAGSGCGGRR